MGSRTFPSADDLPPAPEGTESPGLDDVQTPIVQGGEQQNNGPPSSSNLPRGGSDNADPHAERQNYFGQWSKDEWVEWDAERRANWNRSPYPGSNQHSGSGFSNFQERLPNHLKCPTFDGNYQSWVNYEYDGNFHLEQIPPALRR